jgi:hypothetical protein
VRSTLGRRLKEVDARLADLRALRRTLVLALDRSTELPVADSCVCGIVEAHEQLATNDDRAERGRGRPDKAKERSS